MNPPRKQCVHRITAKGHANDDEVFKILYLNQPLARLLQLDLNTQNSSHWDGLRHYPYQDTNQYYNGVTQEDISGATPNARIGIQSM